MLPYIHDIVGFVSPQLKRHGRRGGGGGGGGGRGGAYFSYIYIYIENFQKFSFQKPWDRF